MPSNYNISDIKQLLKGLSQKTGYSLDYYGLTQMRNEIGGSMGERYLYDLDSKCTGLKKEGETQISLSTNRMDELAKYLEYNGFKDFLDALQKPISPILLSAEGVYYSYLRKSAEREKIVFQSPVKIEKVGTEMVFTLKGPKSEFIGKINYQEGCLFCTMGAGAKSFHHVYQIKKHENPKVLMGVFSGISTSGDPLGGRCILMKIEQNFEDLETKALLIDDMLASSNTELQKLACYFEIFERNNLRIGNSIEFNIYDLER